METTQRSIRLSEIGLSLGGELGLRLSVVYSALFSLLITASAGMNLASFVGLFVFGCVIGILPSIMIGAFTGWLIAKSVERFHGHLSRRVAFSLGVLICIGIALPVLLLTGDLWFFFFPSVIYVCAGGYFGVHLYNKGLKASDQQGHGIVSTNQAG